MRNKPKAQEIYQHFKGKKYQIISLAEHSETGEELVIYQALYNDFRIFARPLSMFMDEIDIAKFRFTLVEPGEKKTMLISNEKISDEKNYGEDISPMKINELKTSEMKRNELKAAELKVIEVNEAELKVIEVNEAELKVDPLVLEFLSAGSHEKRLQILSVLQPRITDNMINTMAISLDIEITDGEIEKRYDELRHCLLTMRKFEINR